eukprot:8947487-Pyramimonas_sp.AAC.2
MPISRVQLCVAGRLHISVAGKRSRSVIAYKCRPECQPRGVSGMLSCALAPREYYLLKKRRQFDRSPISLGAA